MGRGNPPASSPAVAMAMSKNRRRDTKLELKVRRELHRRGLRFRVDYGAAPGRPDVAFTKVKVAVFLDGCFWHGCPLHGTSPKSNADWWKAKIERHLTRDASVRDQLEQDGWLVLRYWAHDDVDGICDEVEDVWRDLSGQAPIDRDACENGWR